MSVVTNGFVSHAFATAAWTGGFDTAPGQQAVIWARRLFSHISHILFRPLFTLGNLPVTPVFLLKSTILILILVVVSRRVGTFMQVRILIHSHMDAGQRYAVARFASFLVFIFGLVIGLESVGVNLNSLVVVGGALGVGVGFGLQNVVGNFVAGLILLTERPLKLGDRVEVGETNGDVIRIGGRSTWVRTNDNVVIIVPNSEFINNKVINWTANDRQVRFHVPVGVSYNSNPEQVREILMQIARQHHDVLQSPAPEVVFTNFGDSSLDFMLRVWTVTQTQTPTVLQSDLYFAIFKAFAEAGIEIPFPQRDLHLRTAEAPVVIANLSRTSPELGNK